MSTSLVNDLECEMLSSSSSLSSPRSPPAPLQRSSSIAVKFAKDNSLEAGKNYANTNDDGQTASETEKRPFTTSFAESLGSPRATRFRASSPPTIPPTSSVSFSLCEKSVKVDVEMGIDELMTKTSPDILEMEGKIRFFQCEIIKYLDPLVVLAKENADKSQTNTYDAMYFQDLAFSFQRVRVAIHELSRIGNGVPTNTSSPNHKAISTEDFCADSVV